MKFVQNERAWNILGITSAILGLILGLFGIILTQVLPRNIGAKTTGLLLVVIAAGFVIMVMVYTCFALKHNYKLFYMFSLGEPELRTDLKRRVYATTDPMPENLTALAAVSSVTSQGNTIRNVPIKMTTAASTTPSELQQTTESEGQEEEDTFIIAARPDRSIVGDEPVQSMGTLTAASGSWRKGVSFKMETPANSDIVDEPTPMPVYETIDRAVSEARYLSLLNTDDPIIHNIETVETVEIPHEDSEPLPAHYVGTDDERIEERLPERPSTPSDSGSIQEAIYDAAEGPQEPDFATLPPPPPPPLPLDVQKADEMTMSTSSLFGTDSQLGEVGHHLDNTERLSHLRDQNVVRRREISEDFNTYQNATGNRKRFLKKEGLRVSTGYDMDSQFDNVSEIGEVDIPHEQVSVAPSDLSYPETEQSMVSSNLMF